MLDLYFAIFLPPLIVGIALAAAYAVYRRKRKAKAIGVINNSVGDPASLLNPANPGNPASPLNPANPANPASPLNSAMRRDT